MFGYREKSSIYSPYLTIIAVATCDDMSIVPLEARSGLKAPEDVAKGDACIIAGKTLDTNIDLAP